MHIISGATGHIGSALAETLLERSEQVTIITHNPEKGAFWKQKGAEVAVADVEDTGALRKIFSKGGRLFLLNPPADPSTDTVKKERETVASFLKALEGSGIEKVVAESTYGARPGDGIGDLGVLYEMEQGLARLSIPVSIIRGAYYMSNWDAFLEMARKEGKIGSLYPAGFKLPMVAPHDIGEFAARLMMEPVEKTGLHYAEGPEEYSPADVAEAFGKALQKPVEVAVIPQEQWISSMQKMGFSEPAAKSMAALTALVLNGRSEKPANPYRGSTSLEKYIAELVNRNGAEQK